MPQGVEHVEFFAGEQVAAATKAVMPKGDG